jgi:oligoendopeptidase F
MVISNTNFYNFKYITSTVTANLIYNSWGVIGIYVQLPENINRGYYTAARRYDFLSSSGENNILRTSAASK